MITNSSCGHGNEKLGIVGCQENANQLTTEPSPTKDGKLGTVYWWEYKNGILSHFLSSY